MNLLDIQRSLGKELNISEILQTNLESQKYGLIITASEAQDIIEARNQAIQSHGRIELGTGVIKKIITLFCGSPYMRGNEYIQNINELIDIFYYFKTETQDLIGDDELLTIMKEFYDSSCQGSLELLRSRELVLFVRDFRSSLLKNNYDQETEQR